MLSRTLRTQELFCRRTCFGQPLGTMLVAGVDEALEQRMRLQGLRLELRMEPVSYTHLDVYKRQADGSPARLRDCVGSEN